MRATKNRLTRRARGWLAESMACLVLLGKGYRVIGRNLGGGPRGEVDILARKGGTLCVVEVKFRVTRAAAHAALHPSQRARLHRLAQAHAQRLGHTGDVRLDAFLVYAQPPFAEHLQNAF